MDFEINWVLPHWLYWGVLIFLPLVVMALVEWSFRRGGEVTGGAETPPAGGPPGNLFTAVVDRISGFTGRFVAYWALIAPFVYSWEVFARYVLNSPTNWAHESMFLMFGMQYVISGAYCLREDGHVRVDVIYNRFSEVVRAGINLLTSTVFFIFTLALTATAWNFFARSVPSESTFFGTGYRLEVSFTEWAIPYAPMKGAMFLGGLLLIIQGLAALVRDIQSFRSGLRSGEGSPRAGWTLVAISAVIAVIAGWEIVNIFVYYPQEATLTLESTLRGVSLGWLTLIMFGSLLVALMAGLPLAFVTGGLAVVFLYIMGDQASIHIIPSRIFPQMTNYQLSAIPLFIFMAAVLEKAGLIEELFDVAYKWMGGLKGGLGIATVAASTLLAAMVGVIGAAVVTMGLIALPAMLQRNYHPTIAVGSVMAGGTLGILIPPSILAIIYGVVAQQSVGELYIGAVVPGLLLAGLYALFIWLFAVARPGTAPALPPEDRVNWIEKFRLLRNMVAPIALVVAVLGAIFTGIATPVEAAGFGTLGALVVAALHGRLTWPNMHAASMTTLKATSMVMWIIFGASIFVGFYIRQGGQDFVIQLIQASGLGPYGILLIMMIVLIALGMFLDWVGILLLAVPIFVPIIEALEFNGVFGLPGVNPGDIALWFGVVYLVNMQMSFLSPPFGYALFYIRGVAPPSITMGMIFKAALPFLALQALGLFLVIIFPDLVTWLPNQVYGGN
ncbi:TRAP transporter large permease subunit [Aquisalimonas lutea]|uniref:TRAP transporter large permease subunit n=1 Tax=Aquisalimonas lutea TaxID=1327750 RepID=UPI0025B58EE8|nr:TRAP transporter large permease subunit [Aquisalimonas lutea]MDN3519183.1 TRAP transporter large permease subunit [Aquisalimonas lutea]